MAEQPLYHGLRTPDEIARERFVRRVTQINATLTEARSSEPAFTYTDARRYAIAGYVIVGLVALAIVGLLWWGFGG